MDNNQMSALENALSGVSPETLLDALHGSMGDSSEASKKAIDRVGKTLEKAGIDTGLKGCREGFVKRQVMTYAGEQTIRHLHQQVSQRQS